MNDVPRQTLRRIIGKYGQEIGGDAKRCESLLNDLCGAYRREINVLVKAIDERVPLDLLAGAASMPREMLLNRLKNRLEEQTAMMSEAAHWAVESWALALNLATDADIEKRNEAADSALNIPTARPVEQDEPAVNQKPPNSNRTIPLQQRPPVYIPPQTDPPVIRQPAQPAPTIPSTHQPALNPLAAPPLNQNQPIVSKRRFGLFRSCLLLFFLLAIISVGLFFGVPYSIEVMRETQREHNIEPPRFPVR